MYDWNLHVEDYIGAWNSKRPTSTEAYPKMLMTRRYDSIPLGCVIPKLERKNLLLMKNKMEIFCKSWKKVDEMEAPEPPSISAGTKGAYWRAFQKIKLYQRYEVWS